MRFVGYAVCELYYVAEKCECGCSLVIRVGDKLVCFCCGRVRYVEPSYRGT